jgi:hypothetical protein
MFVLVDRSLVATSKEVIIPVIVIVFRLNKEDLGRDMQQNLPVTVRICKEFLQQRCVSHLNLIMGCVVGG